MAIIKTFRSNMNTVAVFEDPRPIGNRIYLLHDGYTKDSLDYVVNAGLNHNTSFNALTTYGHSQLSAARYPSVLVLTKETTHCLHLITTNNDNRNNLDLSNFMSMDEQNPEFNHRYITDLAGNSASFTTISNFSQNNDVTNYMVRYNFPNTPGAFDDNPPTKNSTVGNYASWPVYYNPATGFIVQIANVSGGTSGAFPNSLAPGRIRNIFTGPGTTTLTYEAIGATAGVWFQMIGVDPGGRAIFLRTDLANDFTHLIIRYFDIDNTSTTLNTFSTTPGAAGTNAGGNRTTTFGNTIVRLASKTFTDPNSAVTRGWYVPYLDVNGRYHPFYFTWNTATDVFTRASDITVTYPGVTNQSTYWLPDTLSAASSQQFYTTQRYWLNETFVFSGTRYLTLFQCHGSGAVLDGDAKYRTFVTYSVNALDPKLLTYHSHVIIPTTPKNIIWLDDTRTLLGVFGWNNFWIYRFNAVTGWTLTSNLPFRFDAVGRDSLGRIWAVDQGPFVTGRVHILTPSTPATISVQLFESAYNYQGTSINTTATVNAFNISGDRIAATVNLRIEGTSLRIINQSAQEVGELTVTTSNSADTNVSVRVVGAGTSNIVTSINI